MSTRDRIARWQAIGAALLGLPETVQTVTLFRDGIASIARFAGRVHALAVCVEDLRAELAGVRVELARQREQRDAGIARALDWLDGEAARSVVSLTAAQGACVCGAEVKLYPVEDARPAPLRWGGVHQGAFVCDACGGWTGDLVAAVPRDVLRLAVVVEAMTPPPPVRPTLAELVSGGDS